MTRLRLEVFAANGCYARTYRFGYCMRRANKSLQQIGSGGDVLAPHFCVFRHTVRAASTGKCWLALCENFLLCLATQLVCSTDVKAPNVTVWLVPLL
jgi:hypothetical protein